ncbi:MAG: GntR family transcriptional regulator [Streptosporangiales bacterium]|nr:GntR family transcriptional regulator [Streptosporangiales bacterium]
MGRVTMSGAGPLYRRVADAIRTRILNGTLPPGTRLPSRAQITADFGVSEQVARHAVDILLAEGLVTSRPGAGTFVARPPERRRVCRGARHQPHEHVQVFCGEFPRDAARTWGCDAEATLATPVVAGRLGIDAGDRVMCSRYVFVDDARPVMLTTSWEPLALTWGTQIMFPEQGPYEGLGVVARMRSIGIRVDRANEEVTVRPALPVEAERLRLRPGRYVLFIERTFLAGRRTVEVADIVLPADSTRVVYPIEVTGPRRPALLKLALAG